MNKANRLKRILSFGFAEPWLLSLIQPKYHNLCDTQYNNTVERQGLYILNTKWMSGPIDSSKHSETRATVVSGICSLLYCALRQNAT